MIVNQTIRVGALSGPSTRLDGFLQGSHPTVKRAWIREAIERGHVLLNKKISAKGAKVRTGDTIDIIRLPEAADRLLQPDPDVKLNVLLSDDTILVLDKPAGMPVHPLSPDETGTLANGLIAAYPELQTIGDDPLFPALVHRIDIDTSGLILAARTPEAYTDLRAQFKTRQVVKIYTALVHGVPPSHGRLQHHLGHSPGRRGVMRVLKECKQNDASNCFKAITEYDVLKRYGPFSLLRVRIFTGVTHQIRCQLAQAGYPLAGDKVYGRQRAPTLSRHFLHAAHLEFRHPRTGTRVCVDAPLPQDLKEALRKL